MARGTCRCCGNEYSVNADGTVRYHLAADPECHESPGSRKCRGVGQAPAGTVCGHPYPGPEDVFCALAPHTEGDHRDGTTDGDTNVSWSYTTTKATPGFVCRIPAGPTGCGTVVILTSNGRARSHLDPRGLPCPGGSDWPLEVLSDGTRRDTSPDPHRAEADAAIAAVDAEQRADDVVYEQSVRDGLAEARNVTVHTRQP